jgi:hypothetical protein
MFVYLSVRYMNFFGKVTTGTLEIGKNQPSSGSDGQYFEWRGGNGTSDGGTWEWFYDSDGFVAMKLTSNLTKTIIGSLKENSWHKNPLPPIEPWFKKGSEGFFTYIQPTGKKLYCDWKLISAQ